MGNVSMTHQSMQNKSINNLPELKHYVIFIRMKIFANDVFQESKEGQLHKLHIFIELLGTCRKQTLEKFEKL